MSDLNARFEQASVDAKSLSERPDNQTLLRIYALYKQGSEGDIERDKPSMTDMVGFAKWSAWNKLKGTEQDEAKQDFIDLIESLKG
ncbi:MAG: acyl-CoA-binding protein [Burkholderiaceae bacterium]|jgi:diazepam-binding inhibitor (GABA receptor modulator, acyl-CoA-binding protein)|nr:acyl-CoA-binding protein [Burkholderiaceae bacterium]